MRVIHSRFYIHSMYPKLWEESGLPMPELLDQLINLAIEDTMKE